MWVIGRTLLSGRTAGVEGDDMNSLMTAYTDRNYYTATAFPAVLLSLWKVTQRPALHHELLLLKLVCHQGALGEHHAEL